jgi:hypothetical protein
MTRGVRPAMKPDVQTLKDDVAFIRALAEDSRGGAIVRDGATLIAAGAIFGITMLLYWLASAGVLSMPGIDWLWIGASATFLIALVLIQRGDTRRAVASRALRAAWSGVGAGVIVGGAAFGIGAWRLGLPVVAAGGFPIVLLTLYGAAWGVAFAVVRRGWFALVAGGCFAAALACGWFFGRSEEWLVLSVALLVLVATPGAVIMHQARKG